MKWNILFFETNRGEKPVEEFISKQQLQARAKIAHLIDLLEIHGDVLHMPHSKRLANNLFELRIRGRQEIRILYCFRKRNIILLHAFKKQTQQTPQKEVNISLERYSP